jgi:hypothetical protein
MSQMSHESPSTIAHVVAPPIAPKDLVEVLQDADALLTLIGNRPLPTVAEVAQSLTHSAHEAGAHELAEAAEAVSRIASGHQAVALAGAIRNLSAAIVRAQREYHVSV